MVHRCLSSEILRRTVNSLSRGIGCQLAPPMKIVMKRAKPNRTPPAHALPGMSSAAAWFPMLLALQMMQPRVPSKIRRKRVKPNRPQVRTGQGAEISAPREFVSEAPTTVISVPVSSRPGSGSVLLGSPNAGLGDTAAALSGQVSGAAAQLPPSDSADALSQRFAKACSCQLHDFLQWSTLPRSEIHSHTKFSFFPRPCLNNMYIH